MLKRSRIALVFLVLLLPARLASAQAPPAEGSAPPSETPAPVAASTPEAPPGSTSSANLRLRELQNRVVTLKEEIYRTKTRLMLIKERLLNNVIAESKLVLTHRNELGKAFAIREVIYYLDDNKVYYGDAKTANLKKNKEFTVFDGNVVPGHHVLQVEMQIQGDSAVFSYVEDFKFRLRATYTFFAPRGRISTLRVLPYERGGLLTDYRDRPNVRFELQQVPYTRENLQKVSGSEADKGK